MKKELNKSNIEKLYIPGYTVAEDGKYYKYNYEINNIYYCPDNIIIDNFFNNNITINDFKASFNFSLIIVLLNKFVILLFSAII